MKNFRITDFLLGSIATLLLVIAFQMSRPIVVEAKGEDENEVARAIDRLRSDGLKVKLVGEYGYGEPTIKIKN